MPSLPCPWNSATSYHLEEGDLLEAKAVKQGILLKPVTVVERGVAWKQVFEAMGKVKESKPRRKQTPQAQEKEIAGAVKAFRNKRG